MSEAKPTKKGFWTAGRGGAFFAWVDVWARKLDVIGFAIWIFLIWFFVDFSLNSFREFETQAGLYTAIFAVVVLLGGVAIRYTIYRFVQRRNK